MWYYRLWMENPVYMAEIRRREAMEGHFAEIFGHMDEQKVMKAKLA